jgi:hypothetical protein
MVITVVLTIINLVLKERRPNKQESHLLIRLQALRNAENNALKIKNVCHSTSMPTLFHKEHATSGPRKDMHPISITHQQKHNALLSNKTSLKR